jgi:hypothetical protein
VIVELFKNDAGQLVYINTDHIASMTIEYGTAGEHNIIEITMANGEAFKSREDPTPDGELGPEALRILANIAPEMFRAKFDRVQTERAARALAKEAKD